MPDAIRRIAKKHLSNPREITIKVETVTNASIRQRVWMMAGVHKLDALTRILEVEDFDGIIIFVRTRIATVEVADKLIARGYASAALNGDIPQKQRERTVQQLKSGQLDILVATDVAARGLDVERISHVINYDIPYDVEAYVHRIGRTGRAGRTGDAILFAANRERRLLRAIEKATGTIEKMELPTAEQVSDKRVGKFKQRISETLDTHDLEPFRKLVADYQQEYGVPVMDIAAALAALAQGDQSLEAKPVMERERAPRKERDSRREREPRRDREARPDRDSRPEKAKHKDAEQRPAKARAARDTGAPEKGLERFRIEVGHSHGVKPGNIVGAIANEAEIDAEYIGRIDINDEYSTVDLPEGMPKELFKHLKSVWVSGQKLQISRWSDGSGKPSGKPRKSGGSKPATPRKRPAK